MKNISELLNIVRAGAGVVLEAEGLTADDVLPLARAASESEVTLTVRGADPEVILEDKLGICEQLEAEMQLVVDRYQCEWKPTVETPAKVAQFSHFVNSDRTDGNVKFVREREQIRPADADAFETENEDILATG